MTEIKDVKYQGVVMGEHLTISLIKITEDLLGEKIVPVDALQVKSGIFSIILDKSNIWAINRVWKRRKKP